MQTEEVRWKLGGSLLAVEGTGTAAGGEIVHRAFGVITHDSQSAYRMHAFRDGQTLVVDL